MLDLGWAEFAFLVILALVVVGPQDLPKLARLMGHWWGKLQRVYRDSLHSIHRLEREMDLARAPDARNQPSYYDLLPEHVRQMMEQPEPVRDTHQHQQELAVYEQALADVRGIHSKNPSQQQAALEPSVQLSATPQSIETELGTAACAQSIAIKESVNKNASAQNTNTNVPA